MCLYSETTGIDLVRHPRASRDLHATIDVIFDKFVLLVCDDLFYQRVELRLAHARIRFGKVPRV